MVDFDASTYESFRSGSHALEDIAPEVAESFRRLCELSPVPLSEVSAIRAACSSAQSLASLPLGAEPGRPPTGPVPDSIVESFATQFSLDVSLIDDDLRSSFLIDISDRAFGVVQAIWVADMAPRIMSVLDRIFGTSDWGLATPSISSADEMWAEIESFLVVVHSLDKLDDVLAEVVRIRGARQHQCRLCKSLRSRSALVQGADESTFDAIDEPGWPRLPDATRVALSLTDAIIWTPARIDDDLRGAVRSTFDPPTAVEIVLDVMRNAANKIAVALGADQANVTDGTEIYEIDSRGVAHYGLTAP